ncbi:MAG: DUF2971 domain-containing protein [Achromobacter sp.]|nr:DUF2971 domain-containing protein [Achromobacter sp.]
MAAALRVDWQLDRHRSTALATSLRRYTELPYLIDYLQTGELALLNPKAWDDRNDSFYIEEYARAKRLQGIYALCMAEASETYHHWRVFSHGSGGVCVEFDKEKLVAQVRGVPDLRAETVQYRTIKSLREQPPAEADLPFLKRHAFRDEKEFRLFVCRRTRDTPVLRIPVAPATIKRVTLSPWLPATVCDQVKKVLKSIKGCEKLRVFRSTLVENEDWKKFASAGRKALP